MCTRVKFTRKKSNDIGLVNVGKPVKNDRLEKNAEMEKLTHKYNTEHNPLQ